MKETRVIVSEVLAADNKKYFSQMTFSPRFPTSLHRDTTELVHDYFSEISTVDTVLVVNSCARGQAAPESDLNFAVTS